MEPTSPLPPAPRRRARWLALLAAILWIAAICWLAQVARRLSHELTQVTGSRHTIEQKYLALERIALNNTGTQNTTFRWDQVFECLLDPKQWGFAILVFCVSLVSGGISAFGPVVLQGFGLDNYTTMLYNMIPGAIGIVANLM